MYWALFAKYKFNIALPYRVYRHMQKKFQFIVLHMALHSYDKIIHVHIQIKFSNNSNFLT